MGAGDGPGPEKWERPEPRHPATSAWPPPGAVTPHRADPGAAPVAPLVRRHSGGGGWVTEGLSRLHVKARTWRRPWRVAWWLVLLPLAIAAWGATLQRRWARRTAWIAAAGLLLGGLASSATSAPVVVESTSITATTQPTPSSAVPPTSTTTTAQPTSTAPPPTTTAVSTTTTVTTTSTITSTTLAATDGSRPTAEILASVVQAAEHPAGYSRTAFAAGLVVNDAGCEARDVVLRRESTTPIDPALGPCATTGGTWTSPYDASVLADSTRTRVDPVVSLKEAWDSGAWAWTNAQRAAYANDTTDPRTLRAVSSALQVVRGDSDPSNWLPTNPTIVCSYISDWIAIKARWSLTMDDSERGRIRKLLDRDCSASTTTPWVPAPAAPPNVAPAATEPPTTVRTTPTPSVTTPTSPGGSCGSDGYINKDGVCVPSPRPAPSPPDGATAQCKDGTYSFSQHRSGTCSSHGGVARWL